MFPEMSTLVILEVKNQAVTSNMLLRCKILYIWQIKNESINESINE